MWRSRSTGVGVVAALAVFTVGCGAGTTAAGTSSAVTSAGPASSSSAVVTPTSAAPASTSSGSAADTPSSSASVSSSTASVPAVPSVAFTQPTTALAKGLTVSTVIGGGSPVDMVVDTGSNGVLISKKYVGPDVTPLDPARTFSGFSYSSSGKTFSGQWMTATLQLGSPGGTDHPAQTVPILVRVVDEDGVAMMGVGFDRGGSGPDADLYGPALNPFLNLTAMSSGAMPQAYVVGLDGIVLGPTATDLEGFQTVALTRTASGMDWNTASGCVAVPTGGVAAQCGTLLLDTGLGYAIVQVPTGIDPPTTPAAVSTDRPSVSTGQQVQFTVNGLAAPVYDFTVGGTGAPTSVQWGHKDLVDNAPFMNISRYALTQHDYLYDASSGEVGFRAVSG